MKKNYKKIIIVLLMLLVSFTAFSSVHAAITAPDGGLKTEAGWAEDAFNFLAKVLEYIGGAALSGVGAFITPLINGLSLIMFILLETLFRVSAGWASPMPDSICFNRVPLLDANFVNPHEDSLLAMMGIEIFQDLFASFQTIAISVFMVAAMVTGLKLALSTIAVKKAQYKEAAMKWVTGLVILLCLKWILAGIFLVNEIIVSRLYHLVEESDDLQIPIYPTEAIPIIGRLITDLVKSVASLWGGDGTPFYGEGYYGIIAANLMKSIGGDIVASIVTFVMIGQCFTVIGSYIKRVFFTLILGLVSPLIIATDTVLGISGGHSTVFKSWLKNFIGTVFTQSFHAAYLVVVFRILNNIYVQNWTGSYYLQSIITIVLMTGLIKMEKMIKGMFGMGDSMAGDLKSGNKGIMKAMAAAKGAGAAIGAIMDNKPKMQDAQKRRAAFSAEKANIKAQILAGNSGGGNGGGPSATAVAGQIAGAVQNATTAGVQNATNNGGGYNGGGYNGNGGGNGGNGGNGDYLQSVLNKSQQNLTPEQKLHMLEEAEAKAIADEKSAKFAGIMGAANLAAGIGISIGMGDDIGEAMFKGGMITSGLDKLSEGIGRRAADGDRRTLYAQERADLQGSGVDPSDKILRKGKVDLHVTMDDVKLAMNPIEIRKNIKKEFTEVFTNQVQKEMREVDKNLDNE